MSLTLADFAGALDDAKATSSKLAKTKIVAQLIAGLDEQDLRLAIRYASGRPFPATDERVLGVSGAIIGEVVRELLRVDPQTYRGAAIRHGELGEAIAELWPVAPGAEATLRLTDLSAAFDKLAGTTQPATKRSLVYRLFSQCSEPREACYLAKIILNDLRTGVGEGVLQAAIAKAFSVSLDEVLRGQLLVGDLDHVASLAREKRLHEARFTLFHPLQFMLARPIETPADAPGDWIVEDKLDGIRAQAHKQGGRIQIYTRTLDRTDESFPDVVDQLRRIDADFLIDGEIVPWRDGRALPFALLQKRLGRKKVSDGQMRDAPAVLIAFDLLHLGGELLLDRPLVERQARLRSLASQCASLIVLASSVVKSVEDVPRAFEAARAAGNEGLMLKSPTSTYTPGRRGGQWLKLKSHLPTLDCVVTAAEYGHGRKRGKLSDYTLAVWDGRRLVNLAEAYIGVTDAEIAELTQVLHSIAIEGNGRVFQVRPQVVMELAFDQVLESGRHASGFALRFPRIKRIRFDKKPEDADTIEYVREIYASAGNLGRKQKPTPQPPEPTLFDAWQ